MSSTENRSCSGAGNKRRRLTQDLEILYRRIIWLEVDLVSLADSMCRRH